MLSPAEDDWVGIVDDDASVRLSLARLLRLHGVSTRTFATAAELLCYTGAPPSCLILDVQLGTSTGFELRDSLAARGDQLPPIVFITARDDVATLGLINRNGACALLRKPFSSAALLELVNRLRSSSRPRRVMQLSR